MIINQSLCDDYLNQFIIKIGDYKPQLPITTDHYAIIVEPRIDHKFLSVIKNHLYFLNETMSNIKWGLQIFHGTDNQDFLFDILKDINNIKYTNTGIKNFTKLEYNQYIKSSEFWSLVEGKKVLTFQLDTLLLRNGVDEFLTYDYVGAPWTKPKENKFIGNGGLSLRTKDVMLEISKTFKNDEPKWEDIFFVKYLNNYHTPNIETAMKFSVEDVFYPTPLGIHNPIKLTEFQLQHILDNSLYNI